MRWWAEALRWDIAQPELRVRQGRSTMPVTPLLLASQLFEDQAFMQVFPCLADDQGLNFRETPDCGFGVHVGAWV
jgi:hypothetical protein